MAEVTDAAGFRDISTCLTSYARVIMRTIPGKFEHFCLDLFLSSMILKYGM